MLLEMRIGKIGEGFVCYIKSWIIVGNYWKDLKIGGKRVKQFIFYLLRFKLVIKQEVNSEYN